MSANPFTGSHDSEPGPLANMPPDRRWRQQPFPAPAVVALIRQPLPDASDRYLLIRRTGEPYAGHWALVGGKWEFGEEMAGAAVREVKEETGLDAQFVALRAVISERVAPLDADTTGAHFLLLLCDLVVTGGQAAEQAEGQVAWFDETEIKALHDRRAIVPSDYAMLMAFLEADTVAPYVEVDMGASATSVQMYRFHQHERDVSSSAPA